MEIKEWVLAARKHKGWTQTQLGDELGLTKGNISAWEKGRHEPGHGQMVKIAELTGFPFLTSDRAPASALLSKGAPVDVGPEDLVHGDPPDAITSALALLTELLAVAPADRREVIAGLMAGLAREPGNPVYAKTIEGLLEPDGRERAAAPRRPEPRGMSVFGELDAASEQDEKKRAGGTKA